jgi:hypothetical protein
MLTKIVAIGDVHGMWGELWKVLRQSGMIGGVGEASPALLSGEARVVVMGDLVHYKTLDHYQHAVGEDAYDLSNARHLKRAAKAQIRELYRFKTFAERVGPNLTVLLGNHDEAAVKHSYVLATRGGLEHKEFDPNEGGVAIPDELKTWLLGFPRETIIAGVHFAHAGPLISMTNYDDFFYHDPDTKNWWRTKPEYFQQTGCRFGVYGHTSLPSIYLDDVNMFAMIDALDHGEYLELLITEDDDLHIELRTLL